MAKRGPTDPARMTAGGLYNYAVSYHRSADHLAAAGLRVTHREMPIRALYHHCIELYLKAFLRLHGFAPARLRELGHDIMALYREAESRGLEVGGEERWVFSRVSQKDAFSVARYIETGTYFLASLDALTRTAESVRKLTRAHLRADGEPIR